ncbi:hypothetical protein WDV85_02595 [Pseudokineococcus sp. 5B2Z-1]|uniref:hypothetical protein n=1 Tax=Pseudokineococcus sp. 5B2Z-1 TaxID=3132744 RepID=UPI00309B0072
MELKDYLEALRSHLVAALLAATTVLGAGAAYNLLAEPVYVARASVALDVASRQTPRELADGVLLAQRQVPGLVRLIEEPSVLGSVGGALEPPVAAREMTRSVAVEATLDGSVIEVTARGPDPASALDRAGAVAVRLVRLASETTPTGDRRDLRVNASIISPAQQPRAAVAPRRRLTVLVAGAGAFVAAVATAAVADAPNRRRRRRATAAVPDLPFLELDGRPSVGSRHDPRRAGRRRGAGRSRMGNGDEAAPAELARYLLARVGGGPIAVCVLTPASASVDVPDVLGELLHVLVGQDRSVLLVDGVRPPPAATGPAVGLEQVLEGALDMEGVVVRSGTVDLLTSESTPGAVAVMDPIAVVSLFAAARRRYDAVLVACPDPGSSRGLALAGAAEDVLLVAAGPGARAVVAAAGANLGASPARVLGVLVGAASESSEVA